MQGILPLNLPPHSYIFLIYVKLLLLFVLNMGEEIAMWRIRGTFAVMGQRLIVEDEFLSLCGCLIATMLLKSCSCRPCERYKCICNMAYIIVISLPVPIDW